MKSPKRILLVEDHGMVREALRILIESDEAYVVVGEAATGRQAVDQARRLAPHVAVIDINLPELNGIEATRQIHAELPDVQIIGLSVDTSGRVISEILDAGARGYLPKRCASRELFEALRAVLDGKIYVSPEVTEELLQDGRRRHGAGVQPRSLAQLTTREKEVLQLIAEGFPTKEIAAKLSLSITTVHTHRQHLFDKLNARTIADLTRFAIREGLISIDP